MALLLRRTVLSLPATVRLLLAPPAARALAAAAAPPAASSSSAPAPVPAALVKQLREMTGAPMMDCKNALAAEGGDVQKAVDWLRKKGMAAAGKKAGRTAAQGVVGVALAPAGDVGAIVEVRRHGGRVVPVVDGPARPRGARARVRTHAPTYPPRRATPRP